MRLTINTDRGAFVIGLNNPQPRTLIEVRRGDLAAFEHVFCHDFGPAYEPDATVAFTDFRFTAKKPDALGDPDFIIADTSVAKTGTGASAVYAFSPSLNTVALNDLFIEGGVKATPSSQAARYALTVGDDGAALAAGDTVRQTDTQDYWTVLDAAELDNSAGWSDDEPRIAARYVDLEVEASWTQSGLTTSTLPCTLRLWDDVSKGGESTPDTVTITPPAAAIVQSGPALGITGLTGGGATNLDGLTTLGVTRGRLVYVNDATHGPGFWENTTGTTAESAGAGVVRADDYATTTNESLWLRRF